MSERELFVVDAQGGEVIRFPWGAIRWLCSRRICPEAQQTLGEVYIEPGARNALHSHPNCEELLYVASGECDHSLDGRTVHLTAGSMIRVPAGARHHAENTGWEPVRMLICFSSPDRETEGHEEAAE
jgi:quercetin dioxygenase-like cupin family protein